MVFASEIPCVTSYNIVGLLPSSTNHAGQIVPMQTRIKLLTFILRHILSLCVFTSYSSYLASVTVRQAYFGGWLYTNFLRYLYKHWKQFLLMEIYENLSSRADCRDKFPFSFNNLAFTHTHTHSQRFLF